MLAMVSGVQRFSINDGPGIRTTVFMKGCPLRCLWCQNPESDSPEPEIMHYTDEARRRFEKCQEESLAVVEMIRSGKYLPTEGLSAACRAAVEAYYAGDVMFVGEEKSIEELFHEVNQDRVFFDESGGGLTVSGGEPLAQHVFVAALLRRCKEEGIHTVVDTCGHVPWGNIEKVLPFTDLFLYDLKQMDPEKQRQYTGAGNELVLENLRRLSACSANLTVSMAVVPRFNDDAQNAEKVAEFLSGLPRRAPIRLLPYHHLSRSKYRALGIPYAMPDIGEQEIMESVRRFRGTLARFNLQIED